jgi:hypothetical protein
LKSLGWQKSDRRLTEDWQKSFRFWISLLILPTTSWTSVTCVVLIVVIEIRISVPCWLIPKSSQSRFLWVFIFVETRGLNRCHLPLKVVFTDSKRNKHVYGYIKLINWAYNFHHLIIAFFFYIMTITWKMIGHAGYPSLSCGAGQADLQVLQPTAAAAEVI